MELVGCNWRENGGELLLEWECPDNWSPTVALVTSRPCVPVHPPGTLQPDPQWRGLDSTRLLAEVVERVERAGWRVVNCDVVIHAQEPKLSQHKPAIRANLARLLRVVEAGVNVKAKTGEHVGPVGRGEAIVCQAIVLLGP